MAVDPQNRLVVDDLEATWNEKIRIYRECCEQYERKKAEDQLKITDEQRQRVLAMVADFASLWSSQNTDDRDRKRMVRLLISDVTLDKMERDIKVQIRYKGGATEEHILARPKSAWEEKRHSPQVIAEIDRLLNYHTDGQIAELMNSNGFVSGTGKLFDARRVSVIRRAYRLTSLETRLRHRGLFTIKEICEKYGLSRHVVYELRRFGRLKAYRYDDVGRYMYELTDENAFTTMSRGSAV